MKRTILSALIAVVGAGARPMFRVLRIAFPCAALLIAAPPAIAGIEPQPFLNFSVLDPGPSATGPITFEVTIPPDPIIPTAPAIPVEILSMSLAGIAPAGLGVTLAGRDNGGAAPGTEGIFVVGLVGQVPPGDIVPISVDLLFDVGAFMGIQPCVLPATIVISLSAPDLLAVMFDVDFDNSIAHHTLLFEAAGPFEFADVSIQNGNSFNLMFDLVVPFPLADGNRITAGQTLVTMTATGTVSPVPLPAALPLFGSALAMLGMVGWRRRRAGA